MSITLLPMTFLIGYESARDATPALDRGRFKRIEHADAIPEGSPHPVEDSASTAMCGVPVRHQTSSPWPPSPFQGRPCPECSERAEAASAQED